eukprot:294513-Hanusia_phi.AAC.1
MDDRLGPDRSHRRPALPGWATVCGPRPGARPRRGGAGWQCTVPGRLGLADGRAAFADSRC